MRVLIIHAEAEYFAGAEMLLGYFLEEARSHDCRITVAAVAESRVATVIPEGIPRLWLRSNARFSPAQFSAQVWKTARALKTEGYDLVHGWAARDWELTVAAAALCRKPALGTLHDHPRARFISPGRQKLMRWCVNRGFRRLVCISEAVQSACLAAGYSARKLTVIHNGLPPPTAEPVSRVPASPVRLGFLGAFSERKGLSGLFEILAHLAKLTVDWELFVAGAAQEPAGEQLVRAIRVRYEKQPWFAHVHWCGWVNRPTDFLAGIDLLICPSSEFEPFGLVLCEAGWMGIPVLASRTGGIPEIVQDGETGWLFDVGDWRGAAERLAGVLAKPGAMEAAGTRGRQRVQQRFGIEKMVAEYLRLYSTLVTVF